MRPSSHGHTPTGAVEAVLLPPRAASQTVILLPRHVVLSDGYSVINGAVSAQNQSSHDTSYGLANSTGVVCAAAIMDSCGFGGGGSSNREVGHKSSEAAVVIDEVVCESKEERKRV